MVAVSIFPGAFIASDVSALLDEMRQKALTALGKYFDRAPRIDGEARLAFSLS